MKFSEKQREYIRNANRRWNMKSGATQSGKTYLDYTFVVPERMRQRRNQPGLTFILGVSKATIERNILQPMREVYGPGLVGEINSQNIAPLFGETVHCLGAEKVSQVSKLRGASLKYCYGDEVADWNQEVFQMLKSRMSKPGACFDGALNPQHPTHWLKEFLESDIDLYLQEYTIFDNPFLDPKYVSDLCKEYEGTIYYDRYILGKWKRAEGSIYRRFADKPEAFLCDIVDRVDPGTKRKQITKRELRNITVGVDFGGNKSGHAFVASAEVGNYNTLAALKSAREFGEYDSNDIDRMVCEFIQETEDKYGPVQFVYWDNAESVLGRGLKNAICRKFPHIIVRPAIKARIKDRIDCTVRLMGAGRFFYTEDCGTLRIALSDAVWNDKKQEDERLDDGSTDIDSLDSFEYTFERDMNRYLRVG